MSDGLIGDFVFRPGDPALPADDGIGRREELMFWESATQTKDPKALKLMLEEYISLYPTGRQRTLSESA